MRRTSVLTTLLVLFLAGVCVAASAVAKDVAPGTTHDEGAQARYDAARSQAEERYQEDEKLCADQASASLRMQCLRDAKSEYEKRLNTAGETFAAATGKEAPREVCNECGKIVSVHVREQKGEGGIVGLLGGGAVGALLGNQIGHGTGRSVATLAGAAGGAYAGKMVEGRIRTHKYWAVSVLFENGKKRAYNYEQDPGLHAGELVKRSGKGLVRR